VRNVGATIPHSSNNVFVVAPQRFYGAERLIERMWVDSKKIAVLLEVNHNDDTN
jgi:hypothetical protein